MVPCPTAQFVQKRVRCVATSMLHNHFKRFFVRHTYNLWSKHVIGTWTSVLLYISWVGLWLPTHSFINNEREVNTKQSTLFFLQISQNCLKNVYFKHACFKNVCFKLSCLNLYNENYSFNAICQIIFQFQKLLTSKSVDESKWLQKY